MSLVSEILISIWVILPAYLPNSAAAVFGGGKAIDSGSKLNGKRILGDGKTWKGTLAGASAGFGLALIMNQINMILGLEIPSFTLIAAASLGLGAMLGDISASFLKRRLGKDRGRPFPVLDQVDFLIGAILLVYLLDYLWAAQNLDLTTLGILGLLTPLVHVTANIIGYKADIKDEPW